MLIKIFYTFALLGSWLVAGTPAGIFSEDFLSKLSGLGSHDAIVQLPSVMSSVISHPALDGLSGPNKTDMLVTLMQNFTTAAQDPFIQTINNFGVANQTTHFWISNKIAIKDAPVPLLNALSLMPGIFKIREPQIVKLNPFEVSEVNEDHNVPLRAAEVQWGVEKIGAPTVWSKRTKGEGIIVANIDTGVNVNHEALNSNYRGGAGGWYDAVNGNAGPYDDQGHGTHTMGTICGTARGIGVAPDSKWIACKALDEDRSGSETWLSACAQWILKPNNDANLKPHIVSNSWGGGQNLNIYDDEIKAWVTAGIIPIFSIGNSGSNCKTIYSPGDSTEKLISVGSTNKDDTMSSFSSRGPAVSGLMKPEVSAPGGEILSAGHTASNAYVTMSGTSMAAPHVAGATALIMAGKVATTFKNILIKLETTTAKPPVTSADLSCGTVNGDIYPNNAYGYGRIDVRRAFGL